jgi:hypothetical protein
MPDLKRADLETYLTSLLGEPVRVATLSRLGEESGDTGIKGYGYGVPVLIACDVSGSKRRYVLETLSPAPFGHEHMEDRAQMLLWDHRAYDRLPRHVRSLDVGAFAKEGDFISLGRAEEFFLLTEFAEGRGYIEDFRRLAAGGALTDEDLARADALCDYLAEIHDVRGPDPGLYVRRIRELVGHGECIMGLADSYPPRHGFITPGLLEGIERRCVAWRWRIKGLTHRLRQIHGDFHPWNILFREGADFTVLDRSRGEWGDPADDVTSLTMNYLFFSLQARGRLAGPFEILFHRFWDRYLAATGDREILSVAAPFFAFRGLVMASPLWYPALAEEVRRAIFAFLRNVLDADAFDPGRVGEYMKEA